MSFNQNGPIYAIGLMSGTSLDGVDAAFVQVDSDDILSFGPSVSVDYPLEVKARLRKLLDIAQQATGPSQLNSAQHEDERLACERLITDYHIQAVRQLLSKVDRKPDLIGFHGQTILHRPNEGWTWQIGDAQRMADVLNIPVVADFRTNDMRFGGQGAPLVPIFHRALLRRLDDVGPFAVVNIGGVSNVTYVDPSDEESLLGFDTGPGNALLDDWVASHTDMTFDRDGFLSGAGGVDEMRLSELMGWGYLHQSPPKSLDRLDMPRLTNNSDDKGISSADGAATLVAFTVHSVLKSAEFFPRSVSRWFVTGGGRHNPTLMAMLRKYAPQPVDSVDTLGWSGDMLEAQAFAFLALRSARGLSLTVPGTTGCEKPVTGGTMFHPASGKV